MLLPDRKDALHKAWLYRLLAAVFDDVFLADRLCFKGGTCAAMRGLLDRFSIDLDFDYIGQKGDLKRTSENLERIFQKLGMEVKDSSKKIPQYFLKYPAEENQRNTLKIDVSFPPVSANKYEPVRLGDIDRIVRCQTAETMFANKLVALIERFENGRSIAGRDLYDVHHFFMKGLGFDEKVIEERRQEGVVGFLEELANFVDKKINQRIIDQDINMLVAPDKFQRIRKVLKPEVMMFLKDEIGRLKK